MFANVSKIQDYKDNVSVCEIVDRVLFTEQNHMILMNDAFKTITVLRQDSNNLASLTSEDDSEDEKQELRYFRYCCVRVLTG